MSKTKILIGSLVFTIIVVAAAGIYAFTNCDKVRTNGLKGGKVLSANDASQKALAYIKKNLLRGNVSASLSNVKEESGVYKINLKIGGKEYESYVTRDGKFLFLQAFNLTATPPAKQEQKKQGEKTSTIGNFLVSKDEVCKEDGKPTIYFFGSQGCPHCRWEHPIVESVVKNFEGYISFHNNMDSKADGDIFSKYSTGGIPTLVFGCKYYRVGSGEGEGKEQESKNLTALICKLTNNQPANVCGEVKGLTDKIK